MTPWRTLLQDAHPLVELNEAWNPKGTKPTTPVSGAPVGKPEKVEKPTKWVSAGGVVLAGADPEGMSQVWIRKSAANPGYPAQWTFAKGRVDKGETKSTTALREVEEEMGLRAQLLAQGYLGPFEGGYSITHYFLMVARGTPGRHDKETSKVALMPWSKAMAAFAATGNARDVKVAKAAIAHIGAQFEIDAVAGTWLDVDDTERDA